MCNTQGVSTTATHTHRPSGQKEAIMASDVQSAVRDFATAFDTPQARRLIALCEAGTISWDDAMVIATRAVRDGLAVVA